MLKKRVLISVSLLILLVFTLSLIGQANTIPHPLAAYRVQHYRAAEDALRDRYSVTIQSQEQDLPWKEYSYATLYSRELAETWATRKAFLHSLSKEEKEDLVKSELSYLDEHIVFQLYLRSQIKDGYTFAHVVNFNPEVMAFEPQVNQILLEVDDGRMVEAMERHPGGSTVRGGNWRVYNSVVFPAVDEKGKPLFTKATQWAYLWLITPDYRIYFPFYFQ